MSGAAGGGPGVGTESEGLSHNWKSGLGTVFGLTLTSGWGGGAIGRAAGGDPRRVLTLSDMAAAPELGVRDSFHEGVATPADYPTSSTSASLPAPRGLQLPPPLNRTPRVTQYRSNEPSHPA